MKKIRVAFFVDVLQEHFDGVSNTMHQIIRRIPKDQMEAIFITPLVPDEDIGFPVYQCTYVNLYVNKGYRLAVPGWMKGLKKLLDEFLPDVIHWSSPSQLGDYAIKYARRNALPVTTIYHTHFPTYVEYYLGPIARWQALMNVLMGRYFKFYHQSDVVFAPTKGMRDYLVGHGITSSKVKIWGRGVDRKLFNPERRKQNLFGESANPGARKVLFVSRLVKEKETDTLIRLHQLIENQALPLQLVITGDGPDKDRMMRKMPAAIFTGKKQGTALAEIYASCDVFVFPSVTETFGNVVQEAMSCGLPVVAANAGGPADIVEDGKSGYLVEPKNEAAFLEAICALLDDEALYKKMQAEAIDYATRQSWEHLCGQLFLTYKQLQEGEHTQV